MINNMLITIALPTYNNGETKEETIFAYLNQKTKLARKVLKRLFLK